MKTHVNVFPRARAQPTDGRTRSHNVYILSCHTIDESQPGTYDSIVWWRQAIQRYPHAAPRPHSRTTFARASGGVDRCRRFQTNVRVSCDACDARRATCDDRADARGARIRSRDRLGTRRAVRRRCGRCRRRRARDWARRAVFGHSDGCGRCARGARGRARAVCA
jgi:hypothetical protein